ncbi:MAG TPA: hypothetical protein VLG16_00415 [Candidatus Saccharimonadales bacterium]|nr:hypothetical protein [Candidatus Saccharimonadales bacterium]
MSTYAAEYYKGIVQGYGSQDISPILNGQSFPLGDPEQEIRISHLSSLETVVNRYRKVLNDYESVLRVAGSFITDPSSKPADMGELSLPSSTKPDSFFPDGHVRSYARDLLTPKRLIPQETRKGVRLVTGYISGLCIEAIAPDELPDSVIDRAERLIKMPKETTAVVLIESATLVQAKSVGRLASLTVVSPNPRAKVGYKLRGMPITKTEIKKALQNRASWLNSGNLN